MSQVAQPTAETKPTNRWNNISSDEDDSHSDHSDHEEKVQQITHKQPQQSSLPLEAKEEPKKKEANVVPFDAKKKFRGGDFAHLKTVKGGFKAEKLEKKKFHLDTVKNPFAFGNQDDSDSEEEPQQTEEAQQPPTQQQQPAQKPVEEEKKPKKSKKQQEKEELEALLRELKGDSEAKQEGEKKKKKKKAKKAEGEQKEQQKNEKPAEEPKAQEVKPAEQFAVSKQALEELMRKKAEAGKVAPKKSGKAGIANAAKKAIEEREAKNKAKKVYVDL